MVSDMKSYIGILVYITNYYKKKIVLVVSHCEYNAPLLSLSKKVTHSLIT